MGAKWCFHCIGHSRLYAFNMVSIVQKLWVRLVRVFLLLQFVEVEKLFHLMLSRGLLELEGISDSHSVISNEFIDSK